LGRRSSAGMRRNGEVEGAPAIGSEHDEDEQGARARGRNGEEIEGDQIRDVIGKERAPGLRGRCAALRMSRETVRSATWKPSFSSSPWILGAPQTFSGSCQAIFFCGCRSSCRAIEARWYWSSYEAWRFHITKMIFNHFAPNARRAWRCECPRTRC